MDISIRQFETSTETAFSPVTESAVLSVDQVNRVLSQLTSSMELSTLCSLYYSQLATYLPIEHVDLSEFDESLHFGRIPKEGMETIALPVTTVRYANAASPAYIRYCFSIPLTSGQRRVIADLHHLFTQPLCHALEFRRLKLMATKDPLTNLGNRNGFNDALQRMINRYVRSSQIFGLLVVDLDNFKQVNDRFGHQYGDKLLQTTAEVLLESIRGHEEAFRFGGDEFCCLLDVTSGQELNTVAQRIQHAIHTSPLLVEHCVTASIGGSLYRANDAIETLFERADKALYQAKDGGKNTFQAA